MKHRPAQGSTQHARQLRRNATDAKRALGRLLKESFPEARFRRQVPIRHFIVDFASHRASLVIEVDDGQHSAEKDAPRTELIQAEGYRLIRFWNNEVIENGHGVWRAIGDALRLPESIVTFIDSTPTQPPPSRGRGS